MLRESFPDAAGDESIWPAIKVAYIGLLHEHLQPECAETFYNSVACRRARPALLPQRVHLPAPRHLDRAPRGRGADLPRLLPAQGGAAHDAPPGAARLRPRQSVRGPRAGRAPHHRRDARAPPRRLADARQPAGARAVVALLPQQGSVRGGSPGQRQPGVPVRHPDAAHLAGNRVRRCPPAQARARRPRVQPRALVLHGRHGRAVGLRRLPEGAAPRASRARSSTRCWACRSRARRSSTGISCTTCATRATRSSSPRARAAWS